MNTLPATCEAAPALDCLGLDVAKATFDAAFVPRERAGTGTPATSLPAASFPRTPEGVAQLKVWLGTVRAKDAKKDPVRVVMEATGAYSVELAAWLLKAEPTWAPAIVNPHDAMHYRKSLGLRNNTDKLAAQALALFGLERRPQSYEPCPPERAELRALTRYRQFLVEQETALKNRLQEPAPSAFVRKREQAERRHLKQEIGRIEEKTKAHVKAHAGLAHDAKLLQTVTGVGFVIAAVLLAELGDLRRFLKARQLSAFAGLSPEHNESGVSMHGRAHLSKKGSGRARRVLYLSAVTAVRYDNDFSCFYHRLRDEGKTPMAALGAVMRRMLLVMRAMLIAEAAYEPDRHGGGQSGGKLQVHAVNS
jgi:transposase